MELLLVEHGEELGLVDGEAVAVGRVDDVHDSFRVGVVAPPVGADRRLAAEVPHLELDVLVLDRLDVEPDGRDGRHDLANLQPVQDRRLAAVCVTGRGQLGVLRTLRERERDARRVEPEHEYPDLGLAREEARDLGEQGRERDALQGMGEREG